jgi:16S rRNA (guanine527-N7)-methyltransferase
VQTLRVELPEAAIGQFLAFLALLAKWNRTYNLTAIREPMEMVSHHLLDSLAVVPHLPMPERGRLADAGAGAGLPGIPIAIARPQWRLTLNDSSQKNDIRETTHTIELKPKTQHNIPTPPLTPPATVTGSRTQP